LERPGGIAGAVLGPIAVENAHQALDPQMPCESLAGQDDGPDRGLGLTLAGQPGAEFKNVLLGRRPESLLVVPGAQQGIATRFAREVDLGVLPAALQTDEVKLSHHALPLSS